MTPIILSIVALVVAVVAVFVRIGAAGEIRKMVERLEKKFNVLTETVNKLADRTYDLELDRVTIKRYIGKPMRGDTIWWIRADALIHGVINYVDFSMGQYDVTLTHYPGTAVVPFDEAFTSQQAAMDRYCEMKIQKARPIVGYGKCQKCGGPIEFDEHAVVHLLCRKCGDENKQAYESAKKKRNQQ